MNSKYQKFWHAQASFRCPICKGALSFAQPSSLLCENKHCFDVSAKGYVNFLNRAPESKCYDAHFFESRRRILESGFYDHIFKVVLSYLPQGSHYADIGCGEGSFALYLARMCPQAQIYALDLSRDAIKIAAKGGNRVAWMVADLADIPLADHKMDAVLNVFSPANYAEFSRILAPEGVLIKVVPGAQHMKEVRQILKGDSEKQLYSNAEVVDGFERRFGIVHRETVSRIWPLDAASAADLLSMTPVAFGTESSLQQPALTQITIEAEILVSGKRGSI